MKAFVWILTGVGLGFATWLILNQPTSQFATTNGDLEDAAGQASLWGSKQRVKGTGGSILGKAKQGVGNFTGDDSLTAEGLVDEVTGNVKDAAGKAAHAVSDTLHDLNS
jgi:uncharacterized protein YjbJ (UPF0337 family)